MKALLSRCTLRRSIGLVIEEQRIAISIVSVTPLSRRLVFGDVQACGGESTQTVLERMLGPWIKPGRGRTAQAGSWVQLGVPESQVFQAVVPITHTNRNAPPQTYFLEAVQATNIRSEERIIELLKLEIKKQPLACVAASPRVAIESLVGTMAGLGTRVGLAEPVPAALYRAGAYLPQATPRLEAVRAVLPRSTPGDRRDGRGVAAPLLAHIRPDPRPGDGRDPGRLLDPLDAVDGTAGSLCRSIR